MTEMTEPSVVSVRLRGVRLLALTRHVLAAVVLASAWLSSGCFVVALDHFYDDSSIVSDDRLLGTWNNADDTVVVTIERSEWRSYRIKYVHPIETGTLTAYIFKQNEGLYLDLSPVHGQELGALSLAAHAAVRVAWRGDDMLIEPLSYDWFAKGVLQHTLPAQLLGSKTERDQVVLSAAGPALRQWLSARASNDPAFGPAATFKKVP